MLRNYLSVAFRHLKRAPLFTGINLIGLSVGLAVCALIAVFVVDELRFDRHHENADRVVRVVEDRLADGGRRAQASTPPALAAALREDVPSVVQSARLFAMGDMLVEYEGEQHDGPAMFLADSTVFEVLTIPLVRGNPATALTAPFSVVISESLARRVFGEEDPMGQTLLLDRDAFTVTGLMVDPPRESHLEFGLLGSFSTAYDFASAERLSNWIWQQFFTYALLRDASDVASLDASLDLIEANRANPAVADWGFEHDFKAQPLREIYLGSGGMFFDPGPRGSRDTVILFAIVGLLILAIACFNFMNLSTARATVRAREVGMRKVVGAYRGQLVGQFLGESTLMATGSLVLAVGLVWAAARPFEALSGKPIALLTANLLPGLGLAGLVVVLVGLLAGLYPALYLSGFTPSTVLKGTGRGRSASATLRRVLVVAQFAVAVGLIAGTGIVKRQLDYVQNRDLGYNHERLVTISASGEIDNRPGEFKQELLAHPSIVAATGSYGAPSAFSAGDGIRIPQREDMWGIRMMLVDHDFLEAYGMEIVAGRAFDRDMGTDLGQAFILNEAAARELHPDPADAIGQQVFWDRWDEEGAIKSGEVIGVVSDFNFETVHAAVSPMVVHLTEDFITHFTVRLAEGQVADGIGALEDAWARFVPNQPFAYEFVDEDLADDYLAEQRLATITSIFTGLAILIAALGLFALATFVVAQRAREIGVRKVLGASVRSIGALVAADFLRLVGIAFVVGAPVSWLLAQRWLDGFAYHTELGVGYFLAIAGVVLAIAFATVGGQALRAATLDPVTNLRDE